MHELVLKSAAIVRHDGIIVSDISVTKGIIDRIEGNIYFPGEEEINCEGLFLFPGIIDTHVHLREPGYTWKEDFFSGSGAAVTTGVTSVLDMPNNHPPTTSGASLMTKRNLASQKMRCNYGFFIGATGENAKDLKWLEENENFAGIKIYLGSTTGDLLVEDQEILETIFSQGNKIIVVHAEDNLILNKYEDFYRMKKFSRDSEPINYSEIRPREAAIQAVKRIMDLAVKYKRKIHIAHVTTKEEIGIIKNASSNGLVTCEVTPHHLFLSEDDYMRLGNRLKVNPPLRTSDDVEALWQGIADGTVATIASDHAPHTIEEKERGLIESPAGLPGLDTFLPLMLTAISQRSLSLEKIVEMTSYNPARIFGIQNRGQIEEGFVADFTVVNLSKDMLLTPDRIFSRCRWSPFESMLMKAKPDAVYLNGKLAAVEGRLVSGENKGKELVF